ncbi:MAG: response regulator transcription factor [Micrococcales bacterium]|nr:response regulator transcription factor [Micrococcales bacterium]
MPRILFVEDDLSLLASIGYILEREGFSVDCAPTGQEALARAAAEPPDLILLDLNLPDIDGLAVCRRLRLDNATANVPVILVTARTSVDDIVLGLERFADDYVTKPFHPRVLLARVQLLLRQRGLAPAAPDPTLRFDGLEVDPVARSVRVDGRPVDLTRTEFDLLVLFAGHPRRVLTREAILDELRGDEVTVTERTVDFQVAGLRRKLERAARYIATVRGVGYKFEG